MGTQLKKKSAAVRAEPGTTRREAIIEAAIDEFLDKGFASARVEDIAQRAGVAKGTIYLHFADKETLFQAIIQHEIGTHIAAVTAMANDGGSLEQLLSITFPSILQQLVSTRGGAVLRLFLAEASRFPQLANSYYRLVIEPGMAAIRSLAGRSKGSSQILRQYPQLVAAPLLLSVIWTGLFDQLEHLDVEDMARTYFRRLLCEDNGNGQRKRANRDDS